LSCVVVGGVVEGQGSSVHSDQRYGSLLVLAVAVSERRREGGRKGAVGGGGRVWKGCGKKEEGGKGGKEEEEEDGLCVVVSCNGKRVVGRGVEVGRDAFPRAFCSSHPSFLASGFRLSPSHKPSPPPPPPAAPPNPSTSTSPPTTASTTLLTQSPFFHFPCPLARNPGMDGPWGRGWRTDLSSGIVMWEVREEARREGRVEGWWRWW